MDKEKKSNPPSSREEKEAAMETDKLMSLRIRALIAAIQWAKTSVEYPMMVKSVNDYMNASTAGKAFKNDPDAVLHHRKALAMSIVLEAELSISSEQSFELHGALMKIAEDDGHEQG